LGNVNNNIMNIKTKEISEISESVLSFINKYVEEISLNDDLYQLIGSDEWYDISNTDKEPQIGSLSEDMSILKQIIDNKRVVSISDLDRLASIFRAISQSINPV
jgi:hypothetical protein